MVYPKTLLLLKIVIAIIPIFLILFWPLVIFQFVKTTQFYKDKNLRQKYKFYTVYHSLGGDKQWAPKLIVILVQLFWIAILVAIVS